VYKLLDALFGCPHKRRTFPISARPGQVRSEAAEITGTYVVCLDCGREFGYDWREMKIVVAPAAMTPVVQPGAQVAKRAA
jgi:hypothetical protein